MSPFLILADPRGGEWRFSFLDRHTVEIEDPISKETPKYLTSPQDAMMKICDLVVLHKCTGRMHDRRAWKRAKENPKPDVIIEVLGGNVYINTRPENIEVAIVDYDNGDEYPS